MALSADFKVAYESFKSRLDGEMEIYLTGQPQFDKAITHLMTQEELLKKEEPTDEGEKELRALELRYITNKEKSILKMLHELFGVDQKKRITIKLDPGSLEPLLKDFRGVTEDLEYRVKELENRPPEVHHYPVAKDLNSPKSDIGIGETMPDDVGTEDENIPYMEPEDQVGSDDLDSLPEDQNDTPQQPMTLEQMLASLQQVYNPKHKETREHPVKGVGLDITTLSYVLGVPITMGVKKDPYIIGELIGQKSIFDAYADDDDFKLKFGTAAQLLAKGDRDNARALLADTLGDEEYLNPLIEKIQSDPEKRRIAIGILSKFNPNGEDVFTRNIDNGDPKALEKILGAMGVYSLATGTRYNLEKMFKNLA